MLKKLNVFYGLYLLFIFSYIFNHGFYTLAGSFLLLILIPLFFGLISSRLFIKFQKSYFIFSSPRTILIISIFLSLLLYGGYYQNIDFYFIASQFLLIVCLIIPIIFPNFTKLWSILFFTFALLGIFMIQSSPNPQIDVFYMLKGGANALLKGINPYDIDYPAVYGTPFHFFSYLPGMILITLPSSILANDPRYIILISILLCAYLLAKKFKNPEVSLLYLFNPLHLFILEQSWTDSIIFLLILLFIYYFETRRNIISAFFLGIMLASKQYTLFFLFPAWILYQKRIAPVLLGLISAGLIISPFFFWNPGMFWHGIFETPSSGVGFRQDGLTFTSFLFNNFGVLVPFGVLIIVWLTIYVYLFRFNKNTSKPILIFKVFLFMYTFFYFNLYAFANYYYLLSSLLLFSITLIKRQNSLTLSSRN